MVLANPTHTPTPIRPRPYPYPHLHTPTPIHPRPYTHAHTRTHTCTLSLRRTLTSTPNAQPQPHTHRSAPASVMRLAVSFAAMDSRPCVEQSGKKGRRSSVTQARVICALVIHSYTQSYKHVPFAHLSYTVIHSHTSTCHLCT